MNPADYINITALVQWVNNVGTGTIDFVKAAPVMAIVVIVILFLIFKR